MVFDKWFIDFSVSFCDTAISGFFLTRLKSFSLIHLFIFHDIS